MCIFSAVEKDPEYSVVMDPQEGVVLSSNPSYGTAMGKK